MFGKGGLINGFVILEIVIFVEFVVLKQIFFFLWKIYLKKVDIVQVFGKKY